MAGSLSGSTGAASDTEHGGQWVRRPDNHLDRLGVLRFDQGDQCHPGDDSIKHSGELIALGLFLAIVSS